MELRHLRYFAAIAELSSFRRAAERLNLTRPALSKQLRELEEEIGVRLVDRNTARVALTAAGAVYFEQVRDILARTEQATALARETAQGKRGLLEVGEPGALGLSFLAPALTAFREQFPHVDVVLKELSPPEQVTALAHGDIQVGFAFDQHLASMPELESFTVLELRLGAAVGRSHPFARRKQLHSSDLTAERLLCVGDARRSEHARALRKVLHAGGSKHPSINGVAAFGSLMTMIASGHGISLLPHDLASYRPADIVIVPLEGISDLLESELKAIWRKGDDSALVKNFVRTLRRFSKRATS